MAAGDTNVGFTPTWSGPWASLYDDGPWDAGGHEPQGAVAGDHIWGASILVPVPSAASSPVTYQYGLQTAAGVWIWPGTTNGTFTVAPCATGQIFAPGLTNLNGISSSYPPFAGPQTGTVIVNFSVDDTTSKTYGIGALFWKGSMMYDSRARVATLDPTWSGPFAPLYDDGPWDHGGHEPLGAVAGDHIWGVAVLVPVPSSARGPITYEYGLQTQTGTWIWPGANGSFTVAPGVSGTINATGISLP